METSAQSARRDMALASVGLRTKQQTAPTHSPNLGRDAISADLLGRAAVRVLGTFGEHSGGRRSDSWNTGAEKSGCGEYLPGERSVQFGGPMPFSNAMLSRTTTNANQSRVAIHKARPVTAAIFQGRLRPMFPHRKVSAHTDRQIGRYGDGAAGGNL